MKPIQKLLVLYFITIAIMFILYSLCFNLMSFSARDSSIPPSKCRIFKTIQAQTIFYPAIMIERIYYKMRGIPYYTFIDINVRPEHIQAW